MNIKITNDEKNPLFKRREIIAYLGFDNQTPSRKEVKKELAKKLGVKEDLVVVKKVDPDFGTPAAKLEAIVYEDENTLKELEGEYLSKRGVSKEKKDAPAPAEEKKEEEKPAAGAKDKSAEKPAEKPAEEPKPEEKPKEEQQKSKISGGSPGTKKE